MKTKGSVMFVDDEEGVRVSWDRFLSERGFDVTTAVDGERAVNEMQRHPVDVVVSDWRMPSMDGMELLEWMRHEEPETRFILLTGYGDEALERRARELGAFEYLNKPIDPETLAAVITAAMHLKLSPSGAVESPAGPAVVPDGATDPGVQMDEAVSAELELHAPAILGEEEVRAEEEGPTSGRALGSLPAVGGLILAPLLGLAFVIALPIIGFVALFWVLGETAREAVAHRKP